MPALNFKKEFADKVESREKTQTIRAYRIDRKDPKVGQKLYLYTGMRTKACRKLGEAVCQSVEHIAVYDVGIDIGGSLNDSEEAEFIAADGFENREAFFDFFRKTHGLPFWGLLIKWEKL